mmetsp:Transcript_27376/g.45930  ORF Transcript_27376/g.45930 Transcript_27376/m.45930 type:complete len:87 (-) Transcript_27376:1143-1403(-)
MVHDGLVVDDKTAESFMQHRTEGEERTDHLGIVATGPGGANVFWKMEFGRCKDWWREVVLEVAVSVITELGWWPKDDHGSCLIGPV